MKRTTSPRCCPRPPKVRRLRPSERRRVVAVMKALADPTRLEIFRLVAGRPEPICVCDVTARFRVGQPTVSHHLRVLREAGLVKVSRQGVWAHYAADAEGVAAASAACASVLPGCCG